MAIVKHNPHTSSSALSKMFHRAQSLAKHAGRVREKGESIVGQGIRTAEISATAFAVGYMQGKGGTPEILGMPLELVGGLAGHVLGFAGIAGRHSSHIHNAADGALAAYATTVGRGLGLEGKKGGKGKMSGDTEMGRRGVSVSQDTLRNLANYRRASQ